ncbi:MAG: hypothetical protein D6727_03800 [Gammaproteobacteria bacterium]|nr:MAG: hypothetical protein D6727_03800 [Gammaproteobacteria bacterium]
MDGPAGRDADLSPADALAEIRRLIAATEPCLPLAGGDREASLQREAFRERRRQARELGRRLAGCCGAEMLLLDGDIERLRRALSMSRAFFASRAARSR